jgi:hypothetical protein
MPHDITGNAVRILEAKMHWTQFIPPLISPLIKAAVEKAVEAVREFKKSV